jgi:GNAT superfamily N-acetyltransferase
VIDVTTSIRDYAPSDRGACVAVFDSNVPLYFSAEERSGFAAFLADLPCRYLVAELDGAIVGCGGFYVEREGRLGGLAWGMVARARHGRGIGARLLQTRLDCLSREPSIDGVRINTSQHTAAFFERFGFHTEDISTDHFAPGLHRHRMLLRFERADR